MMTHVCPQCSYSWSTGKPSAAPTWLVERDTSTMSEAAVRKYYAARAVYDDACFHVRLGGPLSEAYAGLVADILASGPQARHKGMLAALAEQGRRLRNAAEATSRPPKVEGPKDSILVWRDARDGGGGPQSIWREDRERVSAE